MKREVIEEERTNLVTMATRCSGDTAGPDRGPVAFFSFDVFFPVITGCGDPPT